MASIKWTPVGAVVVGLAAYLACRTYMDMSSFDDYKELVGIAALVGGVVGSRFDARSRKAAPTAAEE